MNELIRAIEKSGLIPGAEIRAWLDGLPRSARPKTPGDLADWLVGRRHLTDYQAGCLLRGKPIRLTYDEYSILDEIGAGGMGRVYKAMHRHMERVVALKVMHPKVMQSVDSVRRFEREVKAAARLSHANIVAAYDAGQAAGAHYLVMEFVEGTNLRELTQRETLDIPAGVNFILQAAEGLQYAHKRGVIHRDIKPANLLVTPGGAIKILDMGIARTLSDDVETESAEYAPTLDHLTQAGVIMGSVDFMAPEQAARANHADQRSDIYSLGCTAFFTLAGREVYRGGTLLQRLFAHQGHDIPSLREEREDVPPQLDQVVRKMIAKRPSDRYQSMDEVIAAFTRVLRLLPEGTMSLPDFALPGGLLDRAAREGGGSRAAASAADAAAVERRSPQAELRRFISTRGAADKFIDFDEEQNIFRKGGDLGLTPDDVEALLAEFCTPGGWNRHRHLSQQLKQQLGERHKSSGVISKTVFDDAVRFLVDHGMRRKAATEECLILMLDHQWGPEEGPEGAWFSRKAEQFGLD